MHDHIRSLLIRAVAVLAVPALTAVSTGCDPESGLIVVKDYENVVTLCDERIDFGALATFALPDSVVDLIDPAEDATDVITSVYNEFILEQIREHFAAAGYTEVDPSMEDPDFFVVVSVTNQTWYDFPYRMHWWVNWSWYGHWPGWDNASTVVYPDHYDEGGFAFPNGTLFIDILDARGTGGGGAAIPGLWTAVMNGVLTDTTIGTLELLEWSIEAAFEQSPYLGTD